MCCSILSQYILDCQYILLLLVPVRLFSTCHFCLTDQSLCMCSEFVYSIVIVYKPAKINKCFYIPVYFGDGYIDLVGRLAEDSMNDAVVEVKASPDTIGAVRCVIIF